MAMSLFGARLAVPLSAAPQPQRSMAKSQRLSVAQPVIRPGISQPAMLTIAARPITSATEQPVWTQASREGQPEPPAPTPAPAPAPAPAQTFTAESLRLWSSVVTAIATVFTIVMAVRGFISDSNTLITIQLAATTRELTASSNVLKSELTTSSSLLKSELTTSSSLLKSELTTSASQLRFDLTTKLDSISKDVSANTTSIREINTKLDTLSANLQAQQVQSAELKGQVTILREGGKKK